MRIAIIGRTEQLYETTLLLKTYGHEVVCILTAKEAPEYSKTSNDFRILAEQWDIPFACGGKVLEHREMLKLVDADIAVSINYTGVMPEAIINIFPYGVLNAHGGDLPRYKGNACQAWAILNGEKRIGLCIHKMIGGELDNGDIIARNYMPINYNTKITDVYRWMSVEIPKLTLKAVNRLSEQFDFTLEIQSKNPSEALRCYPRLPADGVINWNTSAIEVLRLINASNKPYPGAFCYFEGEKLIIWDASLVEDGEIFCAVPGQVTKIGQGIIEIACKTGKVLIASVEYNGHVMKPNEIITSIRKRLS